MKILRILLLFIALSTTTLAAEAASLRVEHVTPAVVGQTFQVTYTLTCSGEAPKKLTVVRDLGWAKYVYGPAITGTGTSSSVTIVNGKVSKSSSSTVSYTYTYRALREGSGTLPAASAHVDDTNVHSAPTTIKVVDAGSAASSYNAPPSTGAPIASADPFNQTAGSGVNGDDTFVRVEMSKPKVYEQEAVVGSVKLYTRYPGQVRCTKLPQFDGFMIEEINIDRSNMQPQIATVGGKRYMCYEMSRYILYPQQSGQLTVAPGEYDIIVQQHDVYSALGMMVSLPVNTEIHVTSNTATVDITPLPSPRPAAFSGAVGSFTLETRLSPDALKTYAPATYSLIVNGTGNLKAIQPPAIAFPKEFDTYDPQTNLSGATAGSDDVNGKVRFDYRIIPQFEGKYEIPAVEFVYFNTTTQQYETLRSPARTVVVGKGTGKPSSHYQLRNKDIDDIDRDAATSLNKTHRFLLSSWWYWAIIGMLTAAFAAFLPLYRKWARDHADDTLMRTRRASKVARRRLKKARTLIDRRDSNAFYAEVLNASWGYLSDKLSIPRSELSKDNIVAEMTQYGFDDNLRDRTIALLDKCEFAQYAPELAGDDLRVVYDEAATLMADLENAKRLTKPSPTTDNNMNTTANSIVTGVLLLLLSFAGTTTAIAAPADSTLTDRANTAYDSRLYQQALALYTQAEKEDGTSAALYTNIGNTYYRLKNRASAILYYERALKLDPSYGAARHNLQFVREKSLVDLRNAQPAWSDSVFGLLNSNGWAVAALIAFALALLATVATIVTEPGGKRRLAFISGIVAALLFALTMTAAIRQYSVQHDNRHAIVIDDNAVITATPDAAGAAKGQHVDDGTKVEILDRIKAKDNSRAWTKVRTADGTAGWVPTAAIANI